ncbi:hypothetical protein F4824DRAFT_459924 [Ustulina deusta]|nr:hypothetical protein F4824DRAFT_459924 [Ustulina deusta]
MLPAALPNARIMTYSYESVWCGDNAVKQSLRGVALKLLPELKEERSECPRRPIIFIGHCFRGLVSLECYMLVTNYKGKYPGISNSTAGMVFLGTPFHGIASDSGMTTMGELYRTIVESNVQTQDNVLHTIAHDNDVLVNTVSEFGTLLESSLNSVKPKIFCFYEQKASKIAQRVAGISGVKPEFLVTESSGTLLGHGKEGLPLDHFSMNKFVSANDNNYKSVRRQILDMNENGRALAEALRSGSLEETQSARLSPIPKYSMQSQAGPILKEENFAKRDGIINSIEERLLRAPYVALYGDSGNGKTHIAVEYAHKFFQDSHGQVHWVNAGSTAEFELSYKRIAATLLINRDGMTNDDILEAVYENLSQNMSGRWLMDLDGLDDEMTLKATRASRSKKSLLDYIPKKGLVRVLATTRSKKIAMRIVGPNPQFVIKVSQLKDVDASLLLLGKVTTDPSQRRKAAARAKELGGSAATLVLAHLYQKKALVDPKAYMEMIHDPQTKDASKTMRAWRLLYELMKEKHADAANLLLFMGSMNVQSIPNSVLERDELFKYVPHLEDYGMVEPLADNTVITVTATIRECVQKCLDEEGEREVTEEHVLSVMCNKLHGDEHRTAEVLLPCALAALKFQPMSAEIKLKLAKLHCEVAKLYGHMKQNLLAADHWERAISPYEEDPENNPNLVQDAKKALKEARARVNSTESQAIAKVETVCISNRVAQKKEELLAYERSAGEHHPDTIRKASEFAAFQLMHGEKREVQASIELCKRVLEWCEQKQGDHSIDVSRQQYNIALALQRLQTACSLGIHYGEQGSAQEADNILRETLGIQRRVLGEKHPDTAMTKLTLKELLDQTETLRE